MLEKSEKRLSSGRVFLYGMLVPGLILVCAYALLGLWPFGNNLILEVDSLHQYLPFITELRRHLVAQESLFYSFSGGLGYNLWANIAYYAASPLNYLTVLMPESAVCDYMLWLILLRLALCGATLSWYLYRREKGSALAAVAFGTAYALSNFFLGYKFNLMWLESIAMAPLIMYGIERLVEERRCGAYIFPLFAAIWCNYFIGYILCVFSCLYFVYRLFLPESFNWGTALRALGRFVLSSLVAAGMSAVLLLPAALALRAGDNNYYTTLFEELFYNNGLSMLLAHFEDSQAIRVSNDRGIVQLYCGLIVLLLLPLYVLNPAFRLKKRLAGLGFLSFFLLSFSFAPLNFIWHGFRLETGLPNRFAFLYLILLFKFSYAALTHLSSLSHKSLVISGGLVAALCAALGVYKAVTAGEYRLFVSLAFVLAYVLLLLRLRGEGLYRRAAALLLCALIIGEAGAHALRDLVGSGSFDKSYYTDYQRDYSALLSSREDTGYFRSEIDSQRMVNFSLYAGGKGIALFDSTMRGDYRLLMSALGMRNTLNTVLSQGQTKLVNDIFGVRYIAGDDLGGEKPGGFEKVAELNGKNLYYNPDALSIGFMVNEEILDWVPEQGRAIETQNDFARLACGIEQLYYPQYSFAAREGKTYVFDVPEGGMTYVEFDRPFTRIKWTTEKSSAIIEGQNYLIGAVSDGEKTKANLSLEGDTGESGLISSWTCSAGDYRHFIGCLSESQMKNVRISGNRLSAAVDASKEGILLITLPWDEGWRIEVDGQEAEKLCVGSALLGVRLAPGSHEISMEFVPYGFVTGFILSLCSLFAAVLIVYFGCFRRKNPLSSADNQIVS